MFLIYFNLLHSFIFKLNCYSIEDKFLFDPQCHILFYYDEFKNKLKSLRFFLEKSAEPLLSPSQCFAPLHKFPLSAFFKPKFDKIWNFFRFWLLPRSPLPNTTTTMEKEERAPTRAPDGAEAKIIRFKTDKITLSISSNRPRRKFCTTFGGIKSQTPLWSVSIILCRLLASTESETILTSRSISRYKLIMTIFIIFWTSNSDFEKKNCLIWVGWS